jgi:Transposase DDE domain
MYLRCDRRFKDGKEHRYWSVVESRRCAGGKVVQRNVLYLGEINDSQRAAWCDLIEAFDEGAQRHTQLVLFPADRPLPEHALAYGMQGRLDAMELHRPRQWGACWLACQLYEQLELDRFWAGRLVVSREGTRWSHILQTLVCYRLIDPGSEWRLHRLWFEQSAMADLLGADYALLYDLTSTYFESAPPQDEEDKRRFGCDKRNDCVQVIIALIVTPEGFPLAYEVLPGNTADCTTLSDFLRKIEEQYGKAERIWVMDRGIPTEEVLSQMRRADPPIYYLVGTPPKGRLSKLEKALLGRPWQAVREGVEVKLLPQEQERARIHKERAMRRRKLKWLWARLKQISAMILGREELLMKLGATRAKARAAWRLLDIEVAADAASFSYALNRNKLRQVRRREGRYLLRTNLCGRDPARLWQFYIQLVEVEAAFKNLKDDLQLRPIYHQLEERIEAHIFVAFLAYCLQITLRARLKPMAPGLTPRAVLDKLAAVQMLDVHFPTTDGRTLVLTRYTELNPDQKLLLKQLNLNLPPQPAPRLTAPGKLDRAPAPAM